MGFLIHSCQNEEFENSFNQESQIQMRKITSNDIPTGITPIVLKDKAELNEFIENIEYLKITKSNEPINNSRRFIKRTKSIEEIESVGTKNITTKVYSNYLGDNVILIHLAYDKEEKEVDVSSENYETWPVATWTQTSGKAKWSGDSSIEYSITGDIKWYVIVELQFIEISKQNFTIEGNTEI